MKRWLTTTVVLGCWAWVGAHTASAQPGYTPPQTSPYPGGLPPALSLSPNNQFYNYYGLALPQYNNARALQQLQMQVNQSGYNPIGVGSSGLQPTMITGHPVTFQNTSHYYPVNGAPFAGMGMGMGGYGGMGGMGGYGGYGGYGGVGGYGGFNGLAPNVNTPLAQGYPQYRY